MQFSESYCFNILFSWLFIYLKLIFNRFVFVSKFYFKSISLSESNLCLLHLSNKSCLNFSPKSSSRLYSLISGLGFLLFCVIFLVSSISKFFCWIYWVDNFFSIFFCNCKFLNESVLSSLASVKALLVENNAL